MPVISSTSSNPARPVPAMGRGDPKRAWAAYEPAPERPWNLARAAHLLRRAGFGATWDELQRALKAGPQRTVDGLLQPAADVAAFNRTFDHNEAAVSASGSAEPLRAWWLRRMIETPQPLLEKMTLFWHDYFATSAAQVPRGAAMRQHVQLLRANALGQFPTLLRAVCRDPATLLSLGAGANRKARPNEQLARQLLDRYTVGPGNYSPEDVRQAARALTGWVVLRSQLRYFPRDHDDGTKTVLGHTGEFTDADVVSITAQHPATARTVVRRLYRWFVSETDAPDDALLTPLANAFARNFDVARLVGTILKSNLFYSPAAYQRRIKRPVEFALALVRGLEGSIATIPLAGHLADLGENLFYPPTSGGWEAGRHWINRATLIRRTNLATALLAPAGPYDGRLDPAATAQRHGYADPGAAEKFLLDLFLQPQPGAGIAEQLRKLAPRQGDRPHHLRQFADMVVTLPEFHLA